MIALSNSKLRTTQDNHIKLILKSQTILIFSGEGTEGIFKRYKGKRTIRALSSYITREQSNGDRWVRVFGNSQQAIPNNIDFTEPETGEYRRIYPSSYR